MSWMVSGWIKNCVLGSGTRKGVMLTIADYCTEDAESIGVSIPEGWSVCWAGIETIAAKAEFTPRTVRRVLDEMEDAGVIRRERRHDRFGHRAFDLIWIEHARRFVDLSGWAPETPGAYRTDSPLGAGNAPTEPVDDPTGLPERQAALGERQTGLGDSDAAHIRNSRHLEPPTNQQHHPGHSTPDRARERRRTRSSSDGGPAPPATGTRHDRPDDREERCG
jgi:hypothetical protein